MLAALRTGNAEALGAALVNDLQVAALRLRPSLRRTLDAGRELGALGSVVSGSGPTCAFLAAVVRPTRWASPRHCPPPASAARSVPPTGLSTAPASSLTEA